MLSEEAINHLALDIKRFLLSDAMLLSRASDTQLQVKIREIIDRKSGNYPMDPADREPHSADGVQLPSGTWSAG